MTMLVKPPALRSGDMIGIIAPASNIKEDLLGEGCRELERLGYRTRFRPDIVSSYRYFAGPDKRRVAEFREMLTDAQVRALFCARGGYGSGRLIPRLEPELICRHPKIVLGSSDITLLLSHIVKAGVVAFHGPMVATSMRQGESAYDRRLLVDILQNGAAARFPTEGCVALRAGEGEGRLVGGCLSLVVSTIGAPWEIDTRDSILLLEDIDTKPYQIDRMITHLKQAGKFDGVRGVVFGEMLNCAQNAHQGYTLEEVVTDLLDEYDFPILYGFPTGHTSRPHIIVPLGVRARLALGSGNVFEMLEPAVTLE
ncbi:MAG TPA: LD-carboxypeptidase [Terriglobia bacterium]|nr:LD-carboxypeptidase [Terriglobia bacterium]